jgi:hypothetical protein
MRHVLLPQAVSAAALRMCKAPGPARLVASAGFAHALATGRLRAIPSTINLPAITVTANEHRSAAQCTYKYPSRRFHRRAPSRQSDIDRDTCFVEYYPRTRAWRGVGHGTGVNLAVWAGVVPVLLGSGLLTSSASAPSDTPALTASCVYHFFSLSPAPLDSAFCSLTPDLRGFAQPFTLIG